MRKSQNRTKRDSARSLLWSASRNSVPKRMVGYVRVSKTSQTVEHQIDALQKLGVVAIFGDEGISGFGGDRPGLAEALGDLRSGDVLCVVALDRLARNLSHLIQIRNELQRRGCHLRSIRECIDTSTATGTLMFHVIGAIAEFERSVAIERTSERLSALKRSGLPVGRRPALTASQIATARRELAAGVSAAVIARNLGCGRSTLYRHLGGRGA